MGEMSPSSGYDRRYKETHTRQKNKGRGRGGPVGALQI